MADSINEAPETTPPTDFIRDIIADDRKVAANGGHVHTRFPPEPNGYLHIGANSAVFWFEHCDGEVLREIPNAPFSSSLLCHREGKR
jgi:tRNA synthetase class I (E and Q)